MKISVVTVALNNAATIESTLDSVALQTHKDIEHIVIDGASTDGTIEIVQRRRGTVAKFVSERDSGIYDAMNRGISLAGGEIIGFLNADDVYADSTVLQTVAETFDDPAVDACYADLVYVDAGDLNQVVRYWKSRPFAPGLFGTGWMPAHPTFFVRNRVYKHCGNFDLSYRFAADFELTLRFLEKCRINAVYVPKIFVKMRLGGTSNKSLANIINQNVAIYRACRQHGVPIALLPFAVRKLLGKTHEFLSKPGDER